MECSTLGFPVHHQLPEPTQTHVHRISNAIQPSHRLSSPFPPTFNLSQIRVFSNETVLRIRWPKYWSFSFSISPSKEHPGLISFIFYFYLDKGFFFFFSFLFFLILKSLILTCVPKHRMDWLDLLAVQGTLKSLLQHHSSKASIFWRSAFFTVQLSHPYMTTRKTIALTRRTLVGKVMSPLC